jgi:YHS domain-containing protein
VQGQKQAGKAEFTAEHQGFTYQFASQKNHAAFQANPAKYGVVDYGNCPVARVKMGKAVKGNPEIYSVYQGKIYLFLKSEAKEMFDANPGGFIQSHSEGSLAPREGSGN